MGTTNIKQKKHLKKNYCHNHAVNLYQPFKILEKEFNLSLEPNSYYILRFDGKSMTKDYKIKNEPINDVFFKTMKETFKQFCLNKLSIIFAYSFSDEISILIRSSSSDEDECRIQKLISLYSSEISVLFFKNAKKFNLTLKRDSLFDARIIKIKKSKLLNYFIARQAFAIDKYMMRLKGKYKIDYKISSSSKVIEELEKIGVNFSKIPAEYRFGIIFYQGNIQKTFEFAGELEKLNTIIHMTHLSL